MKRLTVHSSHIRGLLHDVVDFYPAADLDMSPLVSYRPSTLKDPSKKIGPDDPRYGDLRVLLFLCDKHLSEPFGLTLSTLSSGRVSFSALEALFRPDIELVARDFLGEWQIFMCLDSRLWNNTRAF
jgi:hypothetical protein